MRVRKGLGMSGSAARKKRYSPFLSFSFRRIPDKGVIRHKFMPKPVTHCVVGTRNASRALATSIGMKKRERMFDSAADVATASPFQKAHGAVLVYAAGHFRSK
jgi:hypothetical protein